jgi:protein-disulfide isomerase
MDNHMTKREKQEAKRREKMEREMKGDATSSSKWIIIAVGTLIFLAFFGFIIYSIKESKNKPVELTNAGWVKGSEAAELNLVEFGDLQCPACKAYEPIIKQLETDYKGKIMITYKHFPLTSIHQNALLAARAAEAAGAQNKFWEMHDWLYENQEAWALLPAAEAESKITAAAEKLKLDMDQFEKDLSSKELENKIIAQQNEGIEVGVAATPTFFLNNKRLDPTPKDLAEFKKVIEAELK